METRSEPRRVSTKNIFVGEYAHMSEHRRITSLLAIPNNINGYSDSDQP